MKSTGLVIALAVIVTGVTAAQEGPREGPREHWERLSPQEQALLRQRFQQLERLDPAQRAELERRHARLLEEEERIIAGLSEGARTKLQAMDPERRRQVLLDMAHIELLRRGARLRDKLPPEWVERLEQTPPHERRELMRGYLEGLRGEPGRPPPPRPGMRPPPNGPGPGGGPGRPGGPEGPGGQPGGQRPPLGPPPRLTPETRMALRDLVHPDVEWMIELADLPPFERRRVVETRVRERVLERLRESGELTPEQLTHLESLRGPQFRDAMRRLLGPPPRRPLPEANDIR